MAHFMPCMESSGGQILAEALIRCVCWNNSLYFALMPFYDLGRL